MRVLRITKSLPKLGIERGTPGPKPSTLSTSASKPCEEIGTGGLLKVKGPPPRLCTE